MSPAKKLISASAANLLIPMSGLIVSPLLSRELGPEGRGLYAALTLPIVVCGWIGTYGLQDSLSFHLRTGLLSKRSAAKISLIASIPLGVLGVVLLSVLGLFIFPQGSHYALFLTLSIFAPLHILANLIIGSLTGASDISGVNLVKVLPAIARTVLVIFACLAFDLNAYWASFLFVASIASGLIIGLNRLRRTSATDTGNTVHSNTVPTRSLFVYSLSCLPGVLAGISSARLDQIIGLPLIGAQELGYYAVAVSVAEIPMVIATAARTVIMGRPSSSDSLRATQVARLAVLASLSSCIMLAAAANVAVPWIFGASFTPAVTPTIILCAATTLYTCMTIFSAVLLANGKAAWSSTSLVAGSIVGIVALFVSSPLGAIGAAIASLTGYGVSVICASWAMSRSQGFRSLRQLTIPYREDLKALCAMGRNMRTRGIRQAVNIASWIRHGGSNLIQGAAGPIKVKTTIETFGVSALFVLAWLRILVPQLIQLFSRGRPDFNSRDDLMPAAGSVAGDILSLTFIVLAVVLAISGRQRFRLSEFRWLVIAISPLVVIEVSGLLHDQRPSPVSLALPLAAIAIWLQPPPREALATIGIVCGITAGGSLLMAVVQPEIALLSDAAAGSKSGFIGGLLAGPYLHSNVLGITLALGAPFTMSIKNIFLRRASLLVVLLALVWTGSRTSQLAVMVAMVAYFMLKSQLARGWVVSIPIAAGLALVVLTPLLVTDPDSLTRRGRIWQSLLDRWIEQPILGFGSQYFYRQPDLATDLGGQFSHAHNLLVQLLVVGGLLAVSLFALFLYFAWRQAISLINSGIPAAGLFLIALIYVSWLEASHVSTTLAGYAAWLPLIFITRLGLDVAGRKDRELALVQGPDLVKQTLPSGDTLTQGAPTHPRGTSGGPFRK